MKTRAIIIKKQNTNEYDQLVTCYTEEFGKVTAVAKSVLKPNSIQAMHLDLFNLVGFELVGGSASWRMPIITGAQAENTFIGLKNDLPALAMSYFFAETADKLFFEYQKDEEIWNFLVALLDDLNTGRNDKVIFFRQQQEELLRILGYQTNWEDCGFCAKKISDGKVIFSPEIRGAMCSDCFLEGKKGIFLKNRDFLSGEALDNVFESLAERRLTSLNFLNTVIR